MIKNPLLLGVFLCLASSTALAAKADKHAAVYRNMEAAGERYRQARIKLQAGDDASMAQMASSLEDLEDLARKCLRVRGCDSTRVITQYEALLKSADLLGEQLAGENPDDMDDHHHSPLLANSPEAARSVALLNDGHAFDKMVQLNEPVQAAIREWLTSRRGFLIDSWENYQYMRYLMAPEYNRAGLPEALLFGIMAKESGGKVHAISSSGASGPLQFMPATGTRFGLYRDVTGFDTRFDPQLSARANAAYINERFAALNRSLEYTVAAYNGGEGRAARLYAATGGANYWEPSVHSQLPAETRDYVPAVIAAAWLFLHPKKYGLEFPRIDTTPAQFTLARASSINELTICLGNGGTRSGWFRVLRNLNPRYEAHAMIPPGAVLRAPKKAATLYAKNCLQGPRSALAQELMRARSDVSPSAAVGNAYSQPVKMPVSVAKPAPVKDYRVRPGDSLLGIARQHSCDLSVLARENNLKSPRYMIKPGQQLKLKGCEG